MTKTRFPYILSLLTIFLFFFYPMADADLGWHLRYGETYLRTGRVNLPNTFSWVMPNYVWPNHAWGFDIIEAILFRYGQFLALSLAGTALITGSFALLHWSTRPQALLISLIIFMYFGQELLNIGLRSQLVSLLAVAFLWVQLSKWEQHPTRKLWGLPLLFLVWANLHGEHLLGLGLLWVFTIGWLSVAKHRSTKSGHYLLGISLLSSVAIMVNPFGFGLLQTTLAHLNNPILNNIYEWMPWELNTPRMVLLLGYTAVFWFHIYHGRLTLSRSRTLMYAALTFLALRARRIIPFYLLITLPAWSAYLSASVRWINKLPTRFIIGLMTLFILYIGLVLLPPRNVFTQSWSGYCQSQVLCSEPLITFLETHHLQGRILNSYRLGGHLIYRYPQLPVFIDGRMTVWRDKNDSPFADYLLMVHDQPGGREIFNHYRFDYVIIHPQFALSEVLATAGWPVIYRDSTVLVYQNPLHL